jgi:hypothetical protein
MAELESSRYFIRTVKSWTEESNTLEIIRIDAHLQSISYRGSACPINRREDLPGLAEPEVTDVRCNATAERLLLIQKKSLGWSLSTAVLKGHTLKCAPVELVLSNSSPETVRGAPRLFAKAFMIHFFARDWDNTAFEKGIL